MTDACGGATLSVKGGGGDVGHDSIRTASMRSGSFVEPRPVGRRARRVGVAAFFASVAVNAALGIYAVVAPGFGETQGKILGTSLCITGAVLLALACEPAWERRLLGLVPPAAAVLGVVGFALAIGGIWTEPESETWARVMGTIFTFSIAGVVASLLILARVAPRHEWLFKVTFALLGVGAADVQRLALARRSAVGIRARDGRRHDRRSPPSP